MAYAPKQGDIIKMNFDPTKGHEQQGQRPAVIVSNAAYNHFACGVAMVCPITNTDRGVPVHPRLDSRTKTTGVIMTDQVKALDLTVRNVEFIEQLPLDILAEVCNIVSGYSEPDKRHSR
ncbi:MAG: type II toxin-antitoxin system PemK/MazF family toxin [Defluviitaleaceae bacterium]|nr:type II toxin-antitoxin system PemK/MazF family toxin [Defluviitaleaceae bacterium]